MALVKCPQCGCEMSDKSESCPICGYSILSPSQVESTTLTADCKVKMSEIASRLLNVFEENIHLQKTQPQFQYDIRVEGEPNEFEDFNQWYPYSDDSHFECRTLTNRPQLVLGFRFTKKQEALFKALNISSEFKANNDDPDKICYTLTLKDEAKQAALIVEEVLTKVYQLDTMPVFRNVKCTWQIYSRDNKSLKAYFQNHHPMSFCFDLPENTDLGRIESQYKRVKGMLDKHGFGEVEFSSSQRCIKGFYKPTDEPKGFFAGTHHAGLLASTEAELVKLLSICYEAFK